MPSNSAWALDELNGLKAKLNIADTMDSSLTSSWCIYKVPSKLRLVNEEAYTPCVVSIGPYHHGKKRLKSMQELKVCYLNRFLKRNQDKEKSLEYYFRALKDNEDKIRSCYSETIHIKSHEFVSMVLTDACFIIEFFLVEAGHGQHLVQRLCPTSYILYDLILLENQLPFFVLTLLFDDLTFPAGFHGTSFVNLTYNIFVNFFMRQIYPENTETNMFMNSLNHGNNLRQGLHLCDVLRTFFLPRDLPPRDPSTLMNCSHSVSQLHEAGMEFQADNKSFLTKLRYSKKVLTIPGILVSDSTETMLRNVIAFEQCHNHRISGNVTEYVSLLDDLINNGKDVEILVDKKIMVNWLGDSNEIASMVNKLCNNVVITDNNKDYISLCIEMDNFCKNRCHKYKAIFVREYWNTPWKKTSSIAAALLLSFTLIQTICSIISIISLFKN